MKTIGRPPMPAGKRADVPFNVRLTPAQREKVAALGGAQWIRERIDRARLPDTEPKGTAP